MNIGKYKRKCLHCGRPRYVDENHLKDSNAEFDRFTGCDRVVCSSKSCALTEKKCLKRHLKYLEHGIYDSSQDMVDQMDLIKLSGDWD